MSIIQISVSSIACPAEASVIYDSVTSDVVKKFEEDIGKHHITVTLIDGNYEVVDGFFRLLACKNHGIKTIPAVVIDDPCKVFDSDEIRELAELVCQAENIYEKITYFMKIVGKTTINAKVLAYIPNLPSPAVKNLIEILKLSTEAIDLLKDPMYGNLFNLTCLAEFAKCDFPLEIQPDIIKKLFDFNNIVNRHNTMNVHILVFRYILALEQIHRNPLPNETLDDVVKRASL